MKRSQSPVILIVGGWSPGPLVYLKQFMTSRQSIILQPRNLPMPPFPGTWCCHPKVLFMFAAFASLLWLAGAEHASIAWNILAIVAVIGWFRILAAVVVRTSIEMSAQSCLEVIREYDENVLFLGFSWGGAVLAELLAQRKCGDRPKALLIAPTTSMVATIAYQNDTAFQVSCDGDIHVVHGTGDLAFCPNQTRLVGENLHRINDNHVFFRSSSQRFLIDILSKLLDDTTSDERGDSIAGGNDSIPP